MIRIKNVRPGLLFVSDIKLMLRPGQVAEVETQSKSVQRLLASGHLAQIEEPKSAAAEDLNTGHPTDHTPDQTCDLSRLSAPQAIAKVAEMDDPERIKACMESERRRSVLEALTKKHEEIIGGAE